MDEIRDVDTGIIFTETYYNILLIYYFFKE